MNIQLKNIGIIQDSAIEINGLTVITGKNNSGKTTVGKALYSLIDSVANMKQKSINDRYNYAIAQLEKACECFPFYLAIRRGREYIENICIRIFFTDEYEREVSPDKIDLYLLDLIQELEYFEISEEPYNYILERFQRPSAFRRENTFEKFEIYKEEAISILLRTKEYITSDPELVNYAKQSINSTLALEFNGQIQPVALEGVKSYIEINNNGEACFKINIENNEISESNDIVYWNSPYKKVYFIDNPFVLDEPAFRKINKYTTTNISFVNESRIVTHDDELKFVLNYARPRSIFEEGVIDERYKLIKEKIDAILPGEFAMKDGERFYVNDNVKLNAGNLATGSKMFSIIKILLERGEIDGNTLLILDEPESHLHPKWQNLFVEIMILLVKEIGCHVLLTTHSSQFMLAVDAYMRKYNITDLCNFYQTEQVEDGPFVSYKCVNDSLNLIYEDFVTYLSDIKLMRNQFLMNDDVE